MTMINEGKEQVQKENERRGEERELSVCERQV
jgi:hypothetical protein